MPAALKSTHLAHLLRESLLDYKEFSSHFQFLSKRLRRLQQGRIMTTLEILHDDLKLIWFKYTVISSVRWTKRHGDPATIRSLTSFWNSWPLHSSLSFEDSIWFRRQIFAWFTLYLGVSSLSKLKVANRWCRIYIIEYLKDLCWAPCFLCLTHLYYS